MRVLLPFSLRLQMLAVWLLMLSVPVCSYSGAEDMWFPVGERMEYKLMWGVIPVGMAEFQTYWDNMDGKDVIVIRVVARTTAIVGRIYPVEDFIESIVDPETFLPIRYTQRLREGRHARDDEVTFRHDEGVAVWRAIGRDQTRNIEINEDTRDVLTLTYKMRGEAFKVGEKAAFKVLVDDKLYDLSVEGVAKTEMAVSDVGRISCLEVEPKAKFGGIFVRKGRVRLWFSEDDRRVCVKMTGKVPIAELKAVLEKVSGPGKDAWVAEAEED